MTSTLSADDAWLLPFLRMMSVRPGAYLGSESIFALDLFITAYTLARTDLGFPEYGRGEENLLRDFHGWLEARLNLRDTRGWPGLIERADPSPRNVHTFVELFDEFLKKAAGVVQGLALSTPESKQT